MVADRCTLLQRLKQDRSVLGELFLEGFPQEKMALLENRIHGLKPHVQGGSETFFAGFRQASAPHIKQLSSASDEKTRCAAVFKLECEMLGENYGGYVNGPGFTDEAYNLLVGIAMGDPSELVRAAAIITLAHPGTESFPSEPYHRARYKAVIDTMVGNGADAIAAEAVKIGWVSGEGESPVF